MALTPQELAAINTLNATTGNDYPGDPGGLGNDGHRANFVPALGAVATVGQAAAREAEAAASAAASASAQAAALTGTSTTSVAISAGSKTLTTQAGKAFSPGTFVLLTSNANPTTHYILAQVTAYSDTTLTISVVSIAGSGSRADWTIRVAGGPGVGGADGTQVELQTSATHIQWRLVGGSWANLVALADLRGNDGTPIEVQASATHIQWRYVGGSTWTNIVALSALKGGPGDTGPRGAQILNGARDPVSSDGANDDYWMQTADDTAGFLGDYWTKSGGAWTKLFNTRGPAGSGSGDVIGPNGGVVDGEIMLSNGTTGKSVKGAGITFASLAGAIPSTPADIGAEPAGQLIGINTVTDASYTLVLADAGKVVERSNSSANTVTVPPDASVPFPVGARVDVCQTGTGQTTIAAGSGVTIRSADGKLAIAKQYGGASLYKRAANEWLLIGGIA